ncbi:gluconate 2-dehydrogenase subunit 3 family protein [Rheinheimera sp.]|uniref:gluconate 2-dehydrogenase subunit 3 family protein n=1 Tax=Rheinheimera sp. TaxID=1869214 RepID=UPI00307D200E
MSNEHQQQYRSGLTRRESLKLMLALTTTALLPGLAGCEDSRKAAAGPAAAKATGEHWPELKLEPITAKGYGKDPNLIMPPESPWPLTMTASQLTLLAVVADILVPREGAVPSASEVHVPAVVDEWVSAPYETQQQDRVTILSALAWIDDESTQRYGQSFTSLAKAEQLSIMDDIAYDNAQTKPQFKRIAGAFNRLRSLVLAAFFCTPEGMKDIGYLGNTAIAGDYPGPSAEAYSHLNSVLSQLGLTDYAYPVS